MAANIDSPFKDFPSPHDTTSKSGIQDGGPGAVPGPSGDASPFNVQSFGGLGTTGANFDSPYNEVIVNSVSVVNSADPGGSAPMESPFKDGLAKR